MSRCPRCDADLCLSDARWLPAPDGYAPALRWRHDRPDGAGTCVCYSGPPASLAYTEGAACVTITVSDTLSVPDREAPGRAA